MRVEVNESEELKKERKVEYSIYPENEHDIEILRELQTSIVLANMKRFGKIDNKLEYRVKLEFNQEES